MKRKRRRHPKPTKEGAAYRALWRVVDGAVADVVANHPEYFARGRAVDARVSISKRVVGAINGYARERARGRSGGHSPAADKTGAKPVLAPAGAERTRREAVDTTPPHGGARDLARGGGGHKGIAPAILAAALREDEALRRVPAPFYSTRPAR